MEEKRLLSIFGILGFSASVICVCLGAIVFFLNRKSSLNFLFALAALFASYWTFTEAMTVQASNAANAVWWDKANCLWPFFIVLAVHFLMVFTNTKLAKPKLFYSALYLPAICISLIGLIIDPIYSFAVETYWGYIVTYTDTLVYCLMYSLGDRVGSFWNFFDYKILS